MPILSRLEHDSPSTVNLFLCDTYADVLQHAEHHGPGLHWSAC